MPAWELPCWKPAMASASDKSHRTART
jgi:hypothetical protein